ncbi:hypothetical protein HZS_965, partial [Henneguya salminicola]
EQKTPLVSFQDIKFIIKKDYEEEISLISSILLLAGSIIGTGIFMTPNYVVQSIPSVFYSLLVWIVCGVISLLASLCYAELGLAYPSIGGEYTYFKEIYHDIVSFTYLITNYLLIRPVSIAILVLFFSETTLSFLFENYEEMFWTCRFLSIAAIISICTLNCLSEKWTIIVNDVLTYLKFICMSIIIVLGIYKLARGQFENISNLGFNIKTSPRAISSALYNGMWAYDGFNQLGYIVTKMKNPKRNLVRASILGLLLVVIFYMFINMSYLIILGVEGVSDSNNVVQSAVYPYFRGFTTIITVMISLSALATANSTSYFGGNLYYDAAKNGHFPKLLAAVHSKFKTYIPALTTQTIVTILFLFFAPDIKVLLMYFSGASWVYYSLTFLAVIVSRYGSKIKKPFKIWIGIPAITFVVSCVIVILGFIQDWFSSLISISIIFCSLPSYYFFIYKKGVIPKKAKIFFDNATDWIFEKFNLRFNSEID